MIDIVGRRYWYFGLSLLIIVPGMIALALWGLPLSIDFTSGSLLEVTFPQATQPVDPAQVRAIYAAHGHADSTVQTVETTGIVVRSKPLAEGDQRTILAELEALYGPVTVLTAETVGPTVGAEVARRAALAVGLAAVGILAYIAFAFRKVDHPVRYGVAAVVAMLHDVLVMIGVAAIFGKLFGWEVNALFLTALLTVVGFSVHDSIVVFDRIRENQLHNRRMDYESLVNHSIVQTLDRSLNTQITVMFALLAMALFGGETIRQFVVMLLIGILSGTYSSVFNAAPLLVVWENREWTRLFHRKRAQPA